MASHYHSTSRGPVEIATMGYHHARNAHDKLLREEPHRQEEIRALALHLASLDQDGEEPAR